MRRARWLVPWRDFPFSLLLPVPGQTRCMRCLSESVQNVSQGNIITPRRHVLAQSARRNGMVGLDGQSVHAPSQRSSDVPIDSQLNRGALALKRCVAVPVLRDIFLTMTTDLISGETMLI
jgi:hypothetical protein